MALQAKSLCAKRLSISHNMKQKILLSKTGQTSHSGKHHGVLICFKFTASSFLYSSHFHFFGTRALSKVSCLSSFVLNYSNIRNHNCYGSRKFLNWPQQLSPHHAYFLLRTASWCPADWALLCRLDVSLSSGPLKRSRNESCLSCSGFTLWDAQFRSMKKK